MKVCLINQPAGLGDILFTLKIAVKLLHDKKADKIIWPVSKYYAYISEYIEIDGLEFINEETNFIEREEFQKNKPGIYYINDLLVVNLRRADETIATDGCNKPMYCKYELVNLKDYSDWSTYIPFKRNLEREKKLESVFNIDDKFNLINRVFATYPNTQYANINVSKEDIEITNLGFDRIFDWCGLIAKCNQFHTVETSFCYIARLLNKKDVFVYPRNIKTNFSYIRKAFPSNWTYVS